MRARERYAHRGADDFGDLELLALVLGTGAGGRTTEEVAAGLIQRFGHLQAVASATVEELVRVRGIGPARAVRVHAALQLGRRSLRAVDRGQPVVSVAQASAVMVPTLRALPHEELHGLYLDRRRRPLAHRMLTRGSDAFTVVDPRQVFQLAVGLGSSGVILAHNHPSGDPTPSAQDLDITDRVAAAGRVLGVPLLDHLVVGADRVVSMAEEGTLRSWGRAAPCWTADNP